jgi:hypothetical protein
MTILVTDPSLEERLILERKNAGADPRAELGNPPAAAQGHCLPRGKQWHTHYCRPEGRQECLPYLALKSRKLRMGSALPFTSSSSSAIIV